MKICGTFLIYCPNIDCGYLLEPPHLGGSNKHPQSMFGAKIRKIMYTLANPTFSYIKYIRTNTDSAKEFNIQNRKIAFVCLT